MNERIRALLADAGLFCYNDGTVALLGETYAGQPEIEKFAELIVRECSKVITYGGYWSGGPVGPRRQATPPEIAKMVREHFGVEE